MIKVSLIHGMFWLESIVVCSSAFCAIYLRNPMHNVFALALAFLGSSLIGINLGVEFTAFFIALAYVGAIIVLFLFVVMMIDYSDIKDIKNVTKKYSCITLSSISAIIIIAMTTYTMHYCNHMPKQELYSSGNSITIIGQRLYTDYCEALIILGILLLVAVIGATCIAVRFMRKTKKAANVYDQITRTSKSGVKIVSVQSNCGIDY